MTLGTTHHAAHSAASDDAKVAANEAACEATSEIALTAEASTGYTASLSGPLANQLRALLDSTTPPKAVHDVKSTAYALATSGIALGAVQHDTMLYAYLLDPTGNAQKLSDVALRRLGLKLAGGVAEAADVTLRLANTLQAEVEADADLARLYREIDLPLATVLRQMEETGVELDATVLAEMSTRLATDIHRIEADIHRAGRHRSSTSTRPSSLAMCFSIGWPCRVRSRRQGQGHQHRAGCA